MPSILNYIFDHSNAEVERLRAENAVLRMLLRDIYEWSGKDCPHWTRIEDALTEKTED